MNPYVPILAIGGIGLGFAGFSVLAATLTGPKRYNRAKAEPTSAESSRQGPRLAGGVSP
jgi:NADH-quinone oxidoreductase subunit A